MLSDKHPSSTVPDSRHEPGQDDPYRSRGPAATAGRNGAGGNGTDNAVAAGGGTAGKAALAGPMIRRVPG